jgi:hypothetical protein
MAEHINRQCFGNVAFAVNEYYVRIEPLQKNSPSHPRRSDMLVWGPKVREKEIAQGQFLCPRCYDLRPYKCKKISKYFMLYFIPLFETEKLGRVAECQVCQSTFDANILEPKNQAMFKVLATARYDLRQGTPQSETKSKLLAMGLEDNIADVVLKIVQQ